jgi:glycosyltransferase involved in cell wall biosynthesis
VKHHADASIRLLGALPSSEMAEWYRRSSLFVLPSPNEGFGMVLLEAMASGLPVIASDKSGAQDCVAEGRDGFVVAARNVDALAERILWCYQRRDETRAMGRAARMKIEQQFTLAHYAERQISLYRQVSKEAPGPATNAPPETGLIG